MKEKLLSNRIHFCLSLFCTPPPLSSLVFCPPPLRCSRFLARFVLENVGVNYRILIGSKYLPFVKWFDSFPKETHSLHITHQAHAVLFVNLTNLFASILYRTRFLTGECTDISNSSPIELCGIQMQTHEIYWNQ